MKYTIEADELKLDISGFVRDLTTEAEKQVKEAARAFVRAAIQQVPVRTGFAAGSLLPLSNATGAQIAITVIENLKEYYKGILKSPETGSLFGVPEEQIFTKELNTFYFNYETKIIYYILQDQFKGSSPTSPWGSFEAGRQAWTNYMTTTGVRNLPSFARYLKSFVRKFIGG